MDVQKVIWDKRPRLQNTSGFCSVFLLTLWEVKHKNKCEYASTCTGVCS